MRTRRPLQTADDRRRDDELLEGKGTASEALAALGGVRSTHTKCQRRLSVAVSTMFVTFMALVIG